MDVLKPPMISSTDLELNDTVITIDDSIDSPTSLQTEDVVVLSCESDSEIEIVSQSFPTFPTIVIEDSPVLNKSVTMPPTKAKKKLNPPSPKRRKSLKPLVVKNQIVSKKKKKGKKKKNQLLEMNRHSNELKELVHLHNKFTAQYRTICNKLKNRGVLSSSQALNAIEAIPEPPDIANNVGNNNRVPNNSSTYSSTEQFISENIQFDGGIPKSGLKPIVIDGSNIAMSHGSGRVFSVKGLKICIDYFLNRGHRVYAFIPHFRLKQKQSTDPDLLRKLEDRRLVYCTASRTVEGRKICSYDDRILVQAAAAIGAVIVSCDNYRDLLKEDPRLEGTINRNLLMYTWVEDMLIFPQDPLGRNGPTLERFLRFP